MEEILAKINDAYKKGINDPRFKIAIDEIIKNSESKNFQREDEKPNEENV